MTPAMRHYLLMEHVVGAALVNILLNALIAWLSFRHVDVVPLWGEQSIGGDMIGTTIILPLLTCLIVTRVVAWHLRQGRISPEDWKGDASLLKRLPAGASKRGFVLGVVSTVTVVPLIVGALLAVGIASLELATFLIFKASYAGVLAAIVQPVVALWAIVIGSGAASNATAGR